MADQPMDSRTVKWAEYIDEVTLGTFPTNPVMLAFPGTLEKFSFISAPTFDTYTVLNGAADTDPLSCGVATKAGETHKWSYEGKATSLGLLPHALLSATTSTYVPGVTLLPFSIGMMAGTQFSKITGNVIESWMMEFKDTKSAASIKIDGQGMARSAFSTTYLGTGSHASAEDPDDAFTMVDVTDLKYDGSAFSADDLTVDSLKFGVKNNVGPVIDVGSTNPSKISNWSFGPREYTLELGATFLDDMGAADDVLAGTEHAVAFTLDGQDFAFTGVKWTNAPTIGFTPEDVIGMNLKADPQALRLAIT